MDTNIQAQVISSTPLSSTLSSSQEPPQNNATSEEFRKIIEVEVLKIVKELSEKGETTKERLQHIASTTLGLIYPGQSLEELFSSAVKLDDNCAELAPVVVKIMKIYEEKYEQKALTTVSQMVKAGQYTDAHDLVKKVLLFKVS